MQARCAARGYRGPESAFVSTFRLGKDMSGDTQRLRTRPASFARGPCSSASFSAEESEVANTPVGWQSVLLAFSPAALFPARKHTQRCPPLAQEYNLTARAAACTLWPRKSYSALLL